MVLLLKSSMTIRNHLAKSVAPFDVHLELPGGDGEKIYNDLKMESMFYGMTAMFLQAKSLQSGYRVPVSL